MEDNGRVVANGWCEAVTHELSEQGKKVAALEATVDQHDHVINGNGQAGIATILADFRAEFRTTQAIRAAAAAALSGTAHEYPDNFTATTWTLTSNTTGLAASTAYTWTYIARCN